MLKTLMAPPLGGGARDLGAPTINAKMSMEGPLGGDDGDPGAPTINVKNVDSGPPWEAVPEIQERPPST
jgi:hypothetical protein